MELSQILVGRGLAEVQPTVFQIVSLLFKDEWRRALTSALSPPLREFWTQFEGSHYWEGGKAPATNLILTMRGMRDLVTILGQSRSVYHGRRAMDEGEIVLACTGPGEVGTLASNLLLNDILNAALSRRDVPEEQRRPFGIGLDELQRYDMSKVAPIFNELRQYMIRVIPAVTQDPDRLTQATLKAILTNASHLLIGRQNPGAAAMFARQWVGPPDPVTLTRLADHEFVAVLGHSERGRLAPFRFRQPTPDEVFPDLKRPELVEALDREIAHRTRSLGADEVEAHQRALDEAILRGVLGGGKATVIRLPQAQDDAVPVRRLQIPRPEDLEGGEQ